MGRLFTQYGVTYGRTGLAPAGQTIYDTVARLVRPYPFNMTVIGAREIDHPTTQAGEGLLFPPCTLPLPRRPRCSPISSGLCM